MTPPGGIRRLFRLPATARTVDREVDDELRFHLDARTDALAARGMSRQAAREQALREFGDVGAAQRELAAIDRRHLGRERWAERWATVGQDVRYAVRRMRRQPGFTAVMALTLALGVGANTAIFSVVNAVLLRPLPYRAPEQLVHLWESKAGDVDDRSEASYPDYLDWKAASRAFSALEGYDETNVTVAGRGEPMMLRGARVTPGFFAMLGVAPVLGRAFVPEEDVPGGAPVVVLSHGFWQRAFGGDPGVVGRTLAVDGRPHAVVGVLPPGFHFALVEDADLWFPLDASADRRAARSNHWLDVVGRLRPGVDIERARADLAAVMERLAAQYPESNKGRGILVVPLREQMVGGVRPVLLVLLGAVGLVLLIACANVAGLLLARAAARGREMAVRAALGAGRGRLVRQLLTESVLLALAGGVLAVAIARAGVAGLARLIPEGVAIGTPGLSGLSLDGGILAYAAAVALGTGLIFGVAPALLATRFSLAAALRHDARVASGGARLTLRDALVCGEVALAVVLLVGAGLLMRSLGELMRVDPGFRAERVLTVRVALAGPAYADAGAQQRFFERLLERTRTLPGVREAGAVTNLPLNGGGTNTFRVEGGPEPDAARRPEAIMRGVAGDYFRAMGIRLVAGRAFTAQDDERAPGVIVVNEALARRFLGGRDAVGAHVRFYAFPESTLQVVGVVGDVRTANLDAPAPPTVYYSHLQGAANRLSLVARTAGDPASLSAALRRQVAALDPALPVYDVSTMEEQIARSPAVFTRRYPLVLVGAFAAAALVLAVVGIYGVISYSVTQRTRELGIRIALGAAGGSITRMVVRRGALLAGAGIAAGALIAVALTRFVSSLLFGVSATDPLTYLGVAALIAAVALVASYVPARRAARTDPMIALRAE